MNKISLEKYGPVIGSKTVGAEIYNLIDEKVRKGEDVSIDLSAIKSMATFCAKQIFGRLYIELGSETFFDKIILDKASDDIKTIIQIGIQHAIDESGSK